MATALDLIAELETALDGLSGLVGDAGLGGPVQVARMQQEFVDLEFPPANTVGYKLKVWHAADVAYDSAGNYEGIQCDVDFLFAIQHRDARAYTHGVMLNLQSIILKRSWWRALPSVFEFWPNGELAVDEQPEPVGIVYRFVLTAQLFLTP